MSNLKQNLQNVMQKISAAAKKSRRSAQDIKLLSVTKGRTVQEIKELQKPGQKDFGENRVQELLEKAGQVQGATWHFIGPLQSNKVSKAVSASEYIHSVDSFKLIRKINQAAQEIDKVQNIFLEVNVSGEQTKHGFKQDEILPLLDTLKQLPFKNTRILGLMAMAPLAGPEKTRPVFQKLAGLAAQCHLKELSMGMSNDFEIAIEEGATWIRIGSAIFGK